MQQWVIDNMPVTWCYINTLNERYCTTRLPVGCYVTPEGVRQNSCYLSVRVLGCVCNSVNCALQDKLSEKGASYIFNHVHFIIYHTNGQIVRASVQFDSCDSLLDCTKPRKLPDPENFRSFEIPYTYTVEFKVSLTVPLSRVHPPPLFCLGAEFSGVDPSLELYSRYP